MKNLTLAIDEKLLKKARKIAIDKDTTVSELIRNYLFLIVEKASLSDEESINQLKKHYKNNPLKVGKITWKRDDLYDI